MSIWMELHCDVRDGGRTSDGRVGCWSDALEHPGVLVEHTAASVRAGHGHLRETAREQGWKMTRAQGWICPACQRHARTAQGAA